MESGTKNANSASGAKVEGEVSSALEVDTSILAFFNGPMMVLFARVIL